MKVALLTLGTRGDVQPYAVLGKTLKDRGHQVILATGKNFSSLANAYGLDFTPVEADFQELINSSEGNAMMKNPLTARKHFRAILQPMMVQAMRTFYEVARGADCVLYHVKSMADYFADQFPGKMIRANVVPAILPTSAFPNPVFSALSIPGFLNRFTYKLADFGLAMMNPAVRSFRIAEGLDPKVREAGRPIELYGISESFLPKPLDFPDHVFFTGFWQSESDEPLASDITAFVSSGKKTVVVTFGSMPLRTRFDLSEGLRTMGKELDINILVVKGWGLETDGSYDDDSFKVVAGAPFDKLFRTVDGVVHHGGIGTLSACLRAGVPSLSCPVAYPVGDQYFWGNRAYEVGCAVKPIPLSGLDLKGLKGRISGLLANETIRRNCEDMARNLAPEDGANRAAEIVESRF